MVHGFLYWLEDDGVRIYGEFEGCSSCLDYFGWGYDGSIPIFIDNKNPKGDHEQG